ncbi:MAG TPA: hypothetical protein VMI94_10395 [Bryobacteraceae bacterium]|nr:hypothetical protein [Bryobacteraceae bacterium]
MTLFDLLFLFLALVTLIILLAVLVTALRGRGAQALRMLRNLGIGAAVYLAVVAVVGLLSPQRVLQVGDPWCFDDWCLTVEKVSHAAAPPQVAYTVSLRIFSEAKRVSQRALGAWIYIVDREGNRYPPEPDPSATPLDVRLGPGDSVTTTRTFKVPAGATGLGLITGHGGSPDLSKFVIADEGSLLHKPTYVRLD